MKLSEGVEWAVHTCIALDWVGDGKPVSTAKLAEVFDLPPAYLNKHLQALAKAGIVRSKPGPHGGFSLARGADAVTLLEVVEAIEGPEPAFRCQEIRQRGLASSTPKENFARRCAVAAAMRSADVAWRRALEAQTIAAVRKGVDRDAPKAGGMVREHVAAV